MTRLVKRHLGGGWMAAIDAVGKVGSSIGDLIKQREHDKKQKEIAAMNMQQAQAEQQTAEWRAKAAMAAGQFDRNGESSVTAAINNGMRVIPYNGATAPNYNPAAQPQTNPSVVNSGTLSGVVSSFFKGKKGNSSDEDDEDEVTTAQSEQSLQGNLSAAASAQTEQKGIKGNTPAASPDPGVTPTGADDKDKDLKAQAEELRRQALTTQDKGEYYGLINKVMELEKKVSSGKNGCRLKKRFNPRQFKKQK